MPSAAASPLFSIVIPAYSRADLVEAALRSVQNQTCRDFEWIIVDDGSPEEFAGRLRRWEGEFGFQLIRRENSGPGVARNRGAEAARGEYLIFFDADDVMLPWALEVYRQVVAESKPALVAAAFVEFHDEAELTHLTQTGIRMRSYRDYLACSREHSAVGAGQTIVRRDVWERSGGFTDQRINCEDHDFVLRIGCEPGFVRIEEPVTIGYRRHGSNVTHDWEKTLTGVRYLLEQERAGRYPGGNVRRGERRRIIARHLRPVSLRCCRERRRRAGWNLYLETFGWHLGMGQFKYLLGFPIHGLIG